MIEEEKKMRRKKDVEIIEIQVVRRWKKTEALERKRRKKEGRKGI